MTNTIEKIQAAFKLDFFRREIELLERWEARLNEWLKLTDSELGAKYSELEAALTAYNQTYGAERQRPKAEGKKKNAQPRKTTSRK